MKLKNGNIDCFIPCRKKGDFINNLNFLELEGIKLVEHSIITAERTKLFKNIYLITNDKNYLSWLKYFIEEGKNVRSF